MANTFGNNGHGGLFISLGLDSGTATKALVLDSAFVLGTSGDAIGVRFCSPVSQTNGALLFYAMSDDQAGAPEYTCTLHNSAASGGTESIPAAGAALATSDEIVDPADDEWQCFTFSGVTLTAGSFYWIIIKNTEASDPANNKGAFYTRGALDSHVHSLTAPQLTAMRLYTSTDGFQTSTLSSNGLAPVVIKFNDNSVLGFPYIGTESHASNTNTRGNRFTVPGRMLVSGVFTNDASSAYSGNALYDSAGNVLASKTFDEVGEDNGAYFTVAYETAVNTAYDYCLTFGSAKTGAIYTMVEAEANVPADVKLAAVATYVDGTPGSFSADTSKIQGSMAVCLRDITLPDYPDVGNVTSDDYVNGVQGTFTVPAEADVKTDVQYGADGTEFTGSYSGGGGRPEIRGGNL